MGDFAVIIIYRHPIKKSCIIIGVEYDYDSAEKFIYKQLLDKDDVLSKMVDDSLHRKDFFVVKYKIGAEFNPEFKFDVTWLSKLGGEFL